MGQTVPNYIGPIPSRIFVEIKSLSSSSKKHIFVVKTGNSAVRCSQTHGRSTNYNSDMKVLLTGAAGFIGAAVGRTLLARGDEVVGLDNLNDYYDPELKKSRLSLMDQDPGFEFLEMDCADRDGMARVFSNHRFDRVVHLAAQAGVRYSIENPFAYTESNITGFLSILEGCRHSGIEHLVYASSSSVYGGNQSLPFSVRDAVDHPISLYAVTKKSNELMAHTYSHLFGLPATGLRFFTVYGPWGRPDMAPFLFTKAILNGEPIRLFNHGQHTRDFTYIDDIVAGVIGSLDKVATPDPDFDPKEPHPGGGKAPWRVYNMGRGEQVKLIDYVRIFEKTLGREAKLEMLPLQDGDLKDTSANIESIKQDIGYSPKVSVEEGIPQFLEWYCDYFKVKTG